MRHTFLALKAKNGKNWCTFTEVIAKLKRVPLFWSTLFVIYLLSQHCSGLSEEIKVHH